MFSGDLSPRLETCHRVDPGAEEGSGKEGLRTHEGPTSPPSAFRTWNYVLVTTMGQGGVPPGGGNLAGEDEHTRSLRKESLFVQISSVPLTAPSPPTGKATGAP